MTSRKLGLGIVGAGMASEPHALALRDLAGDIEVRGVVTRSTQSRRAFCAAHGFPEAESLEALLGDAGVEAVLVLTPPDARTELVAAIAAAGKHVLMEKPVERTSAAAAEIVAACERAGVSLGIVLQHRFREASLKLRDLIAQGALGEIAAVGLSVPWWRPQDYYDVPGRGTLARDGGGVLLTQAIHSLDLMLSLAGPVAEVQAVAATTRLHEMETEDFVGAGLRFANGAPGALMATTALFPGGTETLTIAGTRATAVLAGNELRIDRPDGGSETFGAAAGSGGGADPMAMPHGWHRALIADFCEAVRTGRKPAVTGREALEVHHLVEALLRSSAERRSVMVTGAG